MHLTNSRAVGAWALRIMWVRTLLLHLPMSRADNRPYDSPATEDASISLLAGLRAPMAVQRQVMATSMKSLLMTLALLAHGESEQRKPSMQSMAAKAVSRRSPTLRTTWNIHLHALARHTVSTAPAAPFDALEPFFPLM